MWRYGAIGKIDYARPCAINLNTNWIDIKEQCTVALKESYIKKFMKAVGWMDHERTVSYFFHNNKFTYNLTFTLCITSSY